MTLQIAIECGGTRVGEGGEGRHCGLWAHAGGGGWGGAPAGAGAREPRGPRTPQPVPRARGGGGGRAGHPCLGGPHRRSVFGGAVWECAVVGG